MAEAVINLAALPFPGTLETLSYEAILAGMKADLQLRFPFDDLEGEPLVALLETAAWGRLMDRARVNDAAKQAYIAHAFGSGLDNLAAFYRVSRLVISPAQPNAQPPILAVMESDEALRRRLLLALDGQSTAGPRRSYLFHALSSSPLVLDVAVVGPSDGMPSGPLPGNVWVYVLSTHAQTLTNSSGASADALAAVTAALNAENVRPLCDTVSVLATPLVGYTVNATLKFGEGPDRTLALNAARDAVAAYVASRFKIGLDVVPSGIIAALHVPGVVEVTLTAPAARVTIARQQTARCTAITVADGGIGE